ncbi:MAG: hypothetical protein IPL01_08510 [Acidobacteria bacterium]|nr:hypothetical protein [Acidobacteriota bacterium]
MKKLYYIIRTIFIWTMSIIHFFPLCTLLVIMGDIHRPTKERQASEMAFSQHSSRGRCELRG